jgi:LysR family transcriptional regulator, glycine cleavage system transcriptional activator
LTSNLANHNICATGIEKLSRNFMRSLSRLKAIQAFEAAARNASYVGAAAELNVTPAAIGQQVRALEAWLGTSLFHRLDSGSSRLQLTEEAKLALSDFHQGFNLLESGLQKLRERRSRDIVTVTASQAFVAKWLLPRLENFTNLNPKIDIRLDVSDRLLDLAHGDADIGIRCGSGQWPNLIAKKLMDEEIFPVCSPSLLHNKNTLRRPNDLAKQTLIHDATMKREEIFPTWSHWLEFFKCNASAAERGLQINASAAVIQAAISGHGIALARRALVEDDINSGRLIRLFPDHAWPIEWSYFVVYHANAIKKPSVNAFYQWLVKS